MTASTSAADALVTSKIRDWREDARRTRGVQVLPEPLRWRSKMKTMTSPKASTRLQWPKRPRLNLLMAKRQADSQGHPGRQLVRHWSQPEPMPEA